jgi:L-fucose mutarotase/ribose pyranase (RbsD/FucU family)
LLFDSPVIDLGEANAARLATAVFSVFPLDQYSENPLMRMAYDDDISMENDAHRAVREIANGAAGQQWPWLALHRPEFYQRTREASLILRCLESAPYACFLFQKGVV